MAVEARKIGNLRVDDLNDALQSAIARHECALGFLKHQLPRPSNAAFIELQAAEEALRQIQAQRDLR